MIEVSLHVLGVIEVESICPGCGYACPECDRGGESTYHRCDRGAYHGCDRGGGLHMGVKEVGSICPGCDGGRGLHVLAVIDEGLHVLDVIEVIYMFWL